MMVMSRITTAMAGNMINKDKKKSRKDEEGCIDANYAVIDLFATSGPQHMGKTDIRQR